MGIISRVGGLCLMKPLILVSKRLQGRKRFKRNCWYLIPMLCSECLNSKCHLREYGANVTDSWTGIVDIGSKPLVEREAIATGKIVLSSDSIDAVLNGRSPKGDVREASTIAAIPLPRFWVNPKAWRSTKTVCGSTNLLGT